MESGLAGQVAIVTASSRGIGKAVALGLAREGCSVAICARGEEALRRTEEEIAATTGSPVLAVVADVSRAGDITRVVEETAARFGGVDILVNNAGGPPAGLLDEFDDVAWYAAFDLNLMSVVRLIRLVVPIMKERGGGRIINLSSVTVREPHESLLLSSCIRPGVIALAKSLSPRLAKDGILVNNICPGRIDVGKTLQVDASAARRLGKSPADLRREAEEQISLRRYGHPEEIASVAIFLASRGASYMTGATIQVDGGSTRGLY